MRSYEIYLYIFIIFILILLGGCIKGNNPQDSGSETTSGVEIVSEKGNIKVFFKDGGEIIVCDTQYLMFYKESFILDTSTTSDSIIINSLPDGIYNILVYNNEHTQGSILFNIPVVRKRNDITSVYIDSTEFSELYTIKGTVLYDGKPDSTAYVFIQGTPFSSSTDSNGKFTLNGIPAGQYTVKSKSQMLIYRPGETEFKSTIELKRGIKNNTVEITLGN